MVQFTTLRLSGFKSFVEPTELAIEPGMTGVVGPNGCGKSNLVEALRWVMGENSAKQMRGGEMDDVIFGGTSDRPARNLAEVVLALDNAERAAPAMFNDADELEVVRRIERGAGSTFRVNGREVRARDVQLLFADAATGSKSTALVSQGRIGAIVAAKPTDRRHLLEEAAGITGLHSRRHEAELRLSAAEKNLTRLDDVIGALDEQLRGLKRQARQATRYRNLSDHIRRAEGILLHWRWTEATAAREQAAARLAEAETLVEGLTAKPPASPRARPISPPACPSCARRRPRPPPRCSASASRATRSTPRRRGWPRRSVRSNHASPRSGRIPPASAASPPTRTRRSPGSTPRAPRCAPPRTARKTSSPARPRRWPRRARRPRRWRTR